MKITSTLSQITSLKTKSPFALLILMQIAMHLSFNTWMLLTNNFAVENAGFDGKMWGSLQSIREIPGFLSFLVVFLIAWISEQRLAILALLLLAVGVAMTGNLPSYWGLVLATTLSSIGFHYYEAVNQGLQLKWLDKETASQKMGAIVGVGSLVNFMIYLVVLLLWEPLGWTFQGVYLVAGLLSAGIIVYAAFTFPKFKIGEIQNTGIVLRKRYWLFYLLQFFAGARRQIFVVFAGLMMIEKYGFKIHDMAGLMLATFLIGSFTAPLIGRLIKIIGERMTLQMEYIGLALIFGLYMFTYIFDWPAWFAAGLYLIDHIFFAMAIAIKTYFQKIADPKDLSATAAVSFTINHIAAVFLPVLLGLVWLISPAFVFGLGLFLAVCSLTAASLIPRHPKPGYETRFRQTVDGEV